MLYMLFHPFFTILCILFSGMYLYITLKQGNSITTIKEMFKIFAILFIYLNHSTVENLYGRQHLGFGDYIEIASFIMYIIAAVSFNYNYKYGALFILFAHTLSIFLFYNTTIYTNISFFIILLFNSYIYYNACKYIYSLKDKITLALISIVSSILITSLSTLSVAKQISGLLFLVMNVSFVLNFESVNIQTAFTSKYRSFLLLLPLIIGLYLLAY